MVKPSLTTTRPKNLVQYITHTDLFKALDKPAIQDMESELEWVHLAERETLFQQGESGNCLYVVVSGQLGVVITQPDGSLSRPDALHPGAIVSEMGLFTGQTPITAIYTIKESNLVKLSKTGFDRLIKKHPQVFTQFSQFMLPRLRQLQLTSAFNKLFGTLSETALKYLEPELEWIHIYTGDILIRQGDIDNSLYIVISGRLRVVIERPDGSERTLSEVGRGESVGELALLSTGERSATVYAIRDTVVVKLTKTSFDQLVGQYPQVMSQITPLIVYRLQLIIQRLQTSVDNSPLMSQETATIAIIPVSLNVPLSRFATQLSTSLGSALHLNSTSFDQRLSKKGAAQTPKDHPTSLTLETWLSEQETVYNYIVYETDPDWTPWTRRCIRNADRILILGWAEGDSKLGEIESKMAQMTASIPRELVLLHPKMTDRPKETHKWLAGRHVQTHHHIRLNHIEDMQRLTRWLTGGAIGLVLGGMVIAVDVSTETDLTENYKFDVNLSGWKVLWSKLNPFIPEIKAPSLFSTIMRSIELGSVHQREVNKSLADLYINPPVEQFGVGEFEAYEALIEVGYQAAQEAIEVWLDKQKEIWTERYGQYLSD